MTHFNRRSISLVLLCLSHPLSFQHIVSDPRRNTVTLLVLCLHERRGGCVPFLGHWYHMLCERFLVVLYHSITFMCLCCPGPFRFSDQLQEALLQAMQDWLASDRGEELRFMYPSFFVVRSTMRCCLSYLPHLSALSPTFCVL